MPKLTTDERAELEMLRDLKARVVGFGGDDYTLMPWSDAHRHHATVPYIGCPFCRDRFVLADQSSEQQGDTAHNLADTAPISRKAE